MTTKIRQKFASSNTLDGIRLLIAEFYVRPAEQVALVGGSGVRWFVLLGSNPVPMTPVVLKIRKRFVFAVEAA